MARSTPTPQAKPPELQALPVLPTLDAPTPKPDKGARWKIARQVNDAVYRHLEKYTLEEMLEVYRKADPRGYMQFMQEYVRKDRDEDSAGITIVVQQYISTPTPTRGVGGSPVVGDIEVIEAR